MKVSVREFKNHLSEYLRRVQVGEEIIVTSHGKPVGRLLSPQPDDTPLTEAEAIARLEAHPLVSPGKPGKVMGSDKPIKAKPGEILSSILLERE